MGLNIDRELLCGNLNLPKHARWAFGTIHYQIERTSGIFTPNVKCLFQVELMMDREHLYTGSVQNGGIFEVEAFYKFWTPNFNDLQLYFNKSLPYEVRKRFPHLQQIIDSYYPPYKDIDEIIGLRYTYDSPDRGKKVFITNTTKPIEGDTLIETQIVHIILAAHFICRAVKEYDEFKKTRLFALLKPNVSKLKDKIATGAAVVTFYKMAKLAFTLYTGNTYNDDGPGNMGYDLISTDGFADIPEADMADYLCETDFANDSDSSTDIAFTGSDKYSDDNYNRKSAKSAFEEEEHLRKMGDITGADAAHKRGMGHLGRIKG